jgi:hypothetical protein
MAAGGRVLCNNIAQGRGVLARVASNEERGRRASPQQRRAPMSLARPILIQGHLRLGSAPSR